MLDSLLAIWDLCRSGANRHVAAREIFAIVIPISLSVAYITFAERRSSAMCRCASGEPRRSARLVAAHRGRVKLLTRKSFCRPAPTLSVHPGADSVSGPYSPHGR